MLKKYFKYLGGNCNFNKNLKSVIYHFGKLNYEIDKKLYDLNHYEIEYKFIQNKDNITDTLNDINDTLTITEKEC